MPVLILDEQRKIKGTWQGNQADTLKANKLTIYPEDKVTSELILNPVREQFVGEKISIKRTPTYFVRADGKTTTVRSWDGLRDSIIASTNLKINRLDLINPAKNSELTPGSVITITRVNEEKIEETEVINFETEYRGSASIPFGKQSITQAGKDGKRIKKYLITYKNGIEVSRKLLESEIVTPAVKKIVTNGVVVGRANFGYYDGMVTSFYKGMKGRYLLVTNLSNGKSVRVRIIGSGPFNGPLLDMGTEPFQKIGGSLRGGFIPKVSVQLVD